MEDYILMLLEFLWQIYDILSLCFRNEMISASFSRSVGLDEGYCGWEEEVLHVKDAEEKTDSRSRCPRDDPFFVFI